MLKHLRVFLILILSSATTSLHAQAIEGRVVGKDEDVANVHVLNISSNKATITNASGYFDLTATLNDTIRFSAVQFAKKELVVNQEMLEGFMVVKLATSITELDEVVVWPYLLSGDLLRDMDVMEIDRVITASTLELPNADVNERIQSERLLYTARTWDFKVVSVKLDPLINAISGRTKMLKKRVARDLKEARHNRVYASIDTTFITEALQIPKDRIYDFYYFCEADSAFDSVVQLNVKGDVLKFMLGKSKTYRDQNKLD